MSSTEYSVQKTRQQWNLDIARIRAIWYERAIPALRQIEDAKEFVKSFADPFTDTLDDIDAQNISSSEALKRKLGIIQTIFDSLIGVVAMDKYNYANPAVRATVNQYVKEMQAVLAAEPEVQHSHYSNSYYRLDEKSKPKLTKISALTRRHYQKQFFKTYLKTEDVQGLRTWIRKFYCEQYLQSDPKDAKKKNKAQMIIGFLDRNEPTRDDTVQSYMNKTEGNLSLAKLLGQNRISKSDSKIPWGLKQVRDHFGYNIGEHDISANTKFTHF